MRNFHENGRSVAVGGDAMVATSHPAASLVAVDALARGGTAVDAAVAAALLLGQAEPAMTGIGGDCFALVKPEPGAPVVGLNASGRAPMGFDAGALRAAGHGTMPLYDAASVTVPAAMDGFLTLLERFGRLGRDAVFAPAIARARDGLPVTPRVAWDWAEDSGVLQGHARAVYLNAGQPYRLGERFALPTHAEVLSRVVAEGRAGFYEGPVAEDMVASLRALGGTHSAEDFAACRAEWVRPIATPYRGHHLIGLPPNGQGAVALLLAQIMGQREIAHLDPLGAERAHLEAEAVKLAMDARNRLIGDPAHMTLPVERFFAPDAGAALAALIDPGRAMDQPPAAAGAVHRDTIYLTVVDRDGMAVSLIYSIFHGFGSGLASTRYGILFQNRGAGFTLEPGHPNEAGPGKRPLHTIIPAMVERDGALAMSFGVMGGQYQPAGQIRVLGNVLDFGMDPQAAIDAARSFPTEGQLMVEDGYSAGTRAALRALGHRVARPRVALGGAQAIWCDRERGVLLGGSDPRKDGVALGL